MISHTLLGPDNSRVLEGGAGCIEHIFVVARRSLTLVPTLPSRGVAKGGRPPPNRKKNHSLKKAKSVEKWGGGGGTRYIPEAETD